MRSPDPSGRGRAALPAWFLLGWGLACLAGPGCEAAKREAAADAYQQELQGHRKRLRAFQQAYPRVEARLKPLRRSQPRQAARVIRTRLLPLLGRLVDGYGPMIEKGRAYVALLPESVESRPTLEAQLAVFRRQRQQWEEIQRTYREEARLFEKGEPDPDHLQELFDRRIAAARRLQ